MYMGDLFKTWIVQTDHLQVIHISKSLKQLLDYEWFVYKRCKPAHNSAKLSIILINVLTEDGPMDRNML
jgi:hypothetical protein